MCTNNFVRSRNCYSLIFELVQPSAGCKSAVSTVVPAPLLWICLPGKGKILCGLFARQRAGLFHLSKTSLLEDHRPAFPSGKFYPLVKEADLPAENACQSRVRCARPDETSLGCLNPISALTPINQDSFF